jgi:NADH dehydrogenase
LDKTGRVKVNANLSLPGHPEIFAIGDMALVIGKDGKPVPGVSPAAMQMGRYVAELVTRDIRFGAKAHGPQFKYVDKGTMATIGRSAAVAWVGKIHLSGYPAWLMWLFVHLIFLVGFRNRIAVLLNWAYAYYGYKRGARIINTEIPGAEPAQEV